MHYVVFNAELMPTYTGNPRVYHTVVRVILGCRL
jgi:hypothetical protein